MNILGAAYGQPLGDSPTPSRAVPADTIPLTPEMQSAIDGGKIAIDDRGFARVLAKPFEHDFSEPEPDPVLHPEHYTQHPSGIQPIQITKHLNFCLGNVVKYVLRADFKGSAVQDLRKARRYLDIEIEMREQAAA